MITLHGTIDRISEREVFRRFRDSRDRARGGALQVVRVPRPVPTRPAVAFAISRRVGGAVTRNRLRRQLRAATSAAAERGLLGPGSYLVIVTPRAAGSDFTTLSGWLSDAIRQLPGPRAAAD